MSISVYGVPILLFISYLTIVSSIHDTPARCKLPVKIGECRAWYSRWYFNENWQRCEMFHYGGCGGNSNRFLTRRECEKSCRKKERRNEDEHGKNHDICFLPMKPGPCRMLQRKYYFDASTQTCKKFAYGGCHGNKNNFKTAELCEERCFPKCSLPMKRGPCQHNVRRFFYDKHDGRCHSFLWGGCYPNDNNFPTMYECQNSCVTDPGENIRIWNPFENTEEYRYDGFDAGFAWTE
uniref:carboxypeptidase inhibitor SmCI-like n=1 Tax=Styela clava TaxID=7725 RepID=UPI00193A0245|nr:carboxypeptidase inhibitor SmCI-like [Styela clava]